MGPRHEGWELGREVGLRSLIRAWGSDMKGTVGLEKEKGVNANSCEKLL